MKRNRKGVTLIELMVVLVILGVLAAYATFEVVGMFEKRKPSLAKAQIKEFETAVQAFKLDQSKLPDSLNDLIVAPGWAKNFPPNGYLNQRQIPLDPWDHEYKYTTEGSTKFTITSYGADGAPGGAGLEEDIDNYSLAKK